MNNRNRIFFASLLILLSISSNALIVTLSDLHTMAKQSDLVIHGYVGEQRVTLDNLGRLITLTDVEVVDGLYGAKTGDIITIYQVGGQKDGIVLPFLGGHQYKVGQELIFFGLVMGTSYVSYGAGQGKLDITKDRGRELVLEDLGTISTIDKGMPHKNPTKPSPLSFPSVSLLKSEIKQMISTK